MRNAKIKFWKRFSLIAFALLGIILTMAYFVSFEAGATVSGIMAVVPIWGAVKDNTFKELTPDEVAKLEVEDQIKYFNELNAFKAKKMEDLEARMKTQASETIKAEIEELKAEITKQNKEQLAVLQKAMEQQGLAIQKLMTKGGAGENEEGLIVKFFNGIIEKGGLNKASYSADTIIKAAALMTTANIVPETTNGYSPLWGNYIDTEIGRVPKAEPFVLPLITTHTQAGTEKIYYTDRVNEEGDAQFIGEGDLKPLIDGEWQTLSEDVKEVAERWKMSNRLVMHAPSVVSDFREHANELIELKIDEKFLNGDEGVDANEPNGIQTLASAFVVPAELALYYDAANIYDAIMAVATQVRLANYKGALTCALNTVWKAKMAGIKNANGDYIVPPFVTPDGKTIGEVKIIFTNRVAAADIVLGDWKKFHAVFSENVMYAEGYENDDFSKNLMSKKLEAYLGTYIKQSEVGAIVYDQIATILTAIQKV